ncbi:hypothetical protein N7476_005001 [Penicillium atrosanguineum]|uniref:Uncharacterized protein n=1 Tax=Penicillium atrosanguineum TaxID=1132637 RepID=A0A9W9U639_9EURO|nr:hypothetical protein N7476_005001 [Penicillium atrosanguineum]
MEHNDAFDYIANLERRIYRLKRILRECVPYLPQDVILGCQIPQELDSSHILQLPVSPAPPAPSSVQDRRSPPSSSSAPQETWRKPLRIFIDKIPFARKWPGTISPPPVSVLDVLFQNDTALRERDSSTTDIRYRHSDILQTLGNYASLTQKCVNDAKWANFIVSYQKFVLGALCHVACCLGVDPTSVNNMMLSISKGKPDHLQELRHGAAWGAAAIDRLERESSWDIRSGDILFYFTPTFTSLRYWAKANQSIAIFTDRLKEVEYTKSKELLHTNHLSVPCIIKCIFGKRVQLSDVCQSLHCSLDIARKSFAKWYLEPYGSDVMDDIERQQLFSPMTHSPGIGIDYEAESQARWRSQPSRDFTSEARKRRRLNSGFTAAPVVSSSNLDGLPTTPNLSANVRIQTTSNEVSNRFLLNFPDHELVCPSRYASSVDLPQQDDSRQRHLHFTETTGSADVETLSYALPSFNAISEIPSMPHCNFTRAQETTELPSNNLDYCIPSFSQITGIPSP